LVTVRRDRHSVVVVIDVDEAESVARLLLADPLPRRWAHTSGVATSAKTLADIMDNHADVVIAAAWLHDIGYSRPHVHVDFIDVAVAERVTAGRAAHQVAWRSAVEVGEHPGVVEDTRLLGKDAGIRSAPDVLIVDERLDQADSAAERRASAP
jgi:hypothetical protein